MDVCLTFWTSPFSILGYLASFYNHYMCKLFIKVPIFKVNSAGPDQTPHCRHWSDATFCSIWRGSFHQKNPFTLLHLEWPQLLLGTIGLKDARHYQANKVPLVLPDCHTMVNTVCCRTVYLVVKSRLKLSAYPAHTWSVPGLCCTERFQTNRSRNDAPISPENSNMI